MCTDAAAGFEKFTPNQKSGYKWDMLNTFTETTSARWKMEMSNSYQMSSSQQTDAVTEARLDVSANLIV